MPHQVDFRGIFDRSPNPYMVLDRELRYVAANAAYLEVIGGRLEDLLGRQVIDVYPNDPADPNNDSARQLRESLEKVVRTGESDVLAFLPYRVPRQGEGPDVEYRYWSATHTPLFNEDGSVAFVLQHTVDVTSLHSAHEPRMAAGVLDRAARVQENNRQLADALGELRRTRDELEARAALDRQLIGIVSHDLRNPLNAIGIGASILKSSHLDPQQAKVVDRMMGSFERAARLIRDFLDFTQARVSGHLPVTPTHANIRDVTQQVCDEVQPAYPDRRCAVAHAGRAVGQWDPDRVAQLVGNLVSNAFQHAPAGGTVTIRSAEEGPMMVLSVHNDGKPIPPADMSRIFQPFARGAGEVSSKTRSVGLGLFICQRVVEAHGGSIEVRSAEQAGTTFTVRLPYVTIGGSSTAR